MGFQSCLLGKSCVVSVNPHVVKCDEFVGMFMIDYTLFLTSHKCLGS